MRKLAKIGFLVLLANTSCYAIDIPEYSRVAFPMCSCSCQNKIIYKRIKATKENIIAWAKEAAITSLEYGFGNYKSALESASQYYTQAGWERFLEAMLASKNLDILVQNNYVIQASIENKQTKLVTIQASPPQTWTIEIPIEAKYTNARSNITRHLVATLTIIQMEADDDTIQTLGINQFSLRTQRA